MSWKPSKEQGENPHHTAKKERGFAAIFATSLAISKGGNIAAYPYWHLDLNAGSGWNDRTRCLGSPLVFIEEAVKARRRCNALFCDNNPAFTHELSLNITSGALVDTPAFWALDSQLAVCCRDNADFLPEAAAKIIEEEKPRFAVGTLLCDPNGFPHGFPADAIRIFAAHFPRIDLILNFNLSLFARAMGACEAGLAGFAGHPSPEALLKSFPRSHWMVSSPPRSGKGERFMTAIGRNYDAGKRRFLNFYDKDSQEGREILRRFMSVSVEQAMLWKDA